MHILFGNVALVSPQNFRKRYKIKGLTPNGNNLLKCACFYGNTHRLIGSLAPVSPPNFIKHYKINVLAPNGNTQLKYARFDWNIYFLIGNLASVCSAAPPPTCVSAKTLKINVWVAKKVRVRSDSQSYVDLRWFWFILVPFKTGFSKYAAEIRTCS